jgi:hypothetical protein
MTTEAILAIVAVIGLLVGAANVFGTFRVSRNQSAVSGYRDAAAGWEAKARAQEVQIVDLRTVLATANAKIDAQEQRINMLQDMVTSKTLIEALARTLDDNHSTMMGKVTEILALSGDIRTDIRTMARQTGGQANGR